MEAGYGGHLDDRYDYDCEIEPVPPVTQVGVVVGDEAVGQYLKHTLNYEENRENIIRHTQPLIILGAILPILVIIQCQDDRIQQDEDDDGVVECLLFD